MTTARTYLNANSDEPSTLVVVFLRGGADGLNMVIPFEDDGYYRQRPMIALKKNETLDLDGFFGLSPLLKELKPLYDEGLLTVIHEAGSEDTTRSHFEAQDIMEHGGLAAGGWLGRFLRYRIDPANFALSTVALGKGLPESLRGAPAATVMESLEDFALGAKSDTFMRELKKLYAEEPGRLANAARDTLRAMGRLDRLRGTPYRPEHEAEYPEGAFGGGLMQIAQLIKARVGLQAATIDLGGWDTHTYFAQEAFTSPSMVQLSRGLSAFCRDLGPGMKNTTVVVMTEFGRRVRQNSALGTDHGRASVMFVAGGGVRGGRVISRWRGLDEDLLEGPGDLPVRHNYRNALAPILQRHGAGDGLGLIFPDFELDPIDLYG